MILSIIGLLFALVGGSLSVYVLGTFQRVPIIGCYASTVVKRETYFGAMKIDDPLCITENVYHGAIAVGGLLILIGLALLLIAVVRAVSRGAPAPSTAVPPTAPFAGPGLEAQPSGMSTMPASPPASLQAPATGLASPAPAARADVVYPSPAPPESSASPADIETLFAELASAADEPAPPPPAAVRPALRPEGTAKIVGPRPEARSHPELPRGERRPERVAPAQRGRGSYAVLAALALMVIAGGGAAFHLYQRQQQLARWDAELASERQRLANYDAQLAAEKQRLDTDIAAQRDGLRREKASLEARAAALDTAQKALDDRQAAMARAASTPASAPTLSPAASSIATPAPSADSGFATIAAGTVIQSDTTSLSDGGQECDRLAANPGDRNKSPSVAGVPFAVLRTQAAKAVAACEAAATAFPDQPRFVYQYGRALQAVNTTRAKAAFKLAVEQGYPAAFDNLANILIGEKRFGEAAYYLREGVKRGDGDAAITLAGLIESRQVASAYPNEVMELYRLSANNGNANAARRLQELASQQQFQQNMLGVFQMIMPAIGNR